jgi:hypothetical protein
MMGDDLEVLYQEARSLLQEQVTQHLLRCDAASNDLKSCPCPGVMASVAFLGASKPLRGQGMLNILETELPKIWTQDQYSKAFNENPSPYKDFQHAALHVGKALQKLQNMVEEADHRDSVNVSCFREQDVEKYLADIVISVVRMALTSPSGPVDLEKAIAFRVLDKMGVRLPVEA